MIPRSEIESFQLMYKIIETGICEVFLHRRIFRNRRFKKVKFLGKLTSHVSLWKVITTGFDFFLGKLEFLLLDDSDKNVAVRTMLHGVKDALRHDYVSSEKTGNQLRLNR